MSLYGHASPPVMETLNADYWTNRPNPRRGGSAGTGTLNPVVSVLHKPRMRRVAARSSQDARPEDDEPQTDVTRPHAAFTKSTSPFSRLFWRPRLVTPFKVDAKFREKRMSKPSERVTLAA